MGKKLIISGQRQCAWRKAFPHLEPKRREVLDGERTGYVCVPTSHIYSGCSQWGREGGSAGYCTDREKPMLSVKPMVLEHLLHQLLQP